VALALDKCRPLSDLGMSRAQPPIVNVYLDADLGIAANINQVRGRYGLWGGAGLSGHNGCLMVVEAERSTVVRQEIFESVQVSSCARL